jgi:hypothetical protein
VKDEIQTRIQRHAIPFWKKAREIQREISLAGFWQIDVTASINLRRCWNLFISIIASLQSLENVFAEQLAGAVFVHGTGMRLTTIRGGPPQLIIVAILY